MANGTVQRSALVIAILGGILAAVAVFLSWSTGGFVTTGLGGTRTSEKTTSTVGISVTGGKVALGIAIVVIGAAIGRAVLQSPTPRRVASVVILAGAVALLIIGIREALDLSSEEGLFILRGITESGEEIRIGSETSVGIGVWLTIVAGVAAAVGGTLGFLRAGPATPGPIMEEEGAGL
jgi:hypothetical protein